MRLPPLSQLLFATVLGVGSGYYAFNEPLRQYAAEAQAKQPETPLPAAEPAPKASS